MVDGRFVPPVPAPPASLWTERLTPLGYNTYYENTQTREIRWLKPRTGPKTTKSDAPEEPGELEQQLPPHINFGMPVTLKGTNMKRCDGVSGILEDFDSDRCIIRLPEALGGTYLTVKMQDHEKLRPLECNTCVRCREEGESVWLVTEYNPELEIYRLREPGVAEGRTVEMPAREVIPASSFPDVEKSIGKAGLPFPQRERKPPDADRKEPVKREPEDTCSFIGYDGVHHEFQLWLPKSFSVQKKHPLLIFLHGSGGGSFCTLRKRGDVAGLDFAKKCMIVVSPVCNWKWQEQPQDWVGQLIQQLSLARYVDKSRIYLCGLSMGGKGVYHFAASPSFGELFAAVAAVGPHHDPADHDRLAQALGDSYVPILFALSDRDDVCPWSDEIKLEKDIKMGRQERADRDLKVHMLEGKGKEPPLHAQVKNYIIEEESLFQWLLSHINAALK